MDNEFNIAFQAVRADFPLPDYMDTSPGNAYENIAQTVRRYLPRGSRILDFGSGPMDKTAVIQRLGYVCSACDDLNDSWHFTQRDTIQNFARQQGIDFRLIDGPLPFPSKSFDMVMMHDVLEHLHESPRNLVAALLELIRDEGFLFATVPNAANIRKRVALLRGSTNLPDFDAYFWFPRPWRGHVREYVKRDILLLGAYLGLQIKEVRTAHHMLHRVPNSVRPIYRAVTAMFPGWRDTWVLVAQKPRGWKLPTIDAKRYNDITTQVSHRPIPSIHSPNHFHTGAPPVWGRICALVDRTRLGLPRR